MIRLYYDLITAPVTEKHYYKTTTITPAGEEIVGEYIEDPDKTSTVLAVVDSEYEAAEQPVFGGVSYDFGEAKPSDKTVTVKKDGENLVELFYSRTDDQRVITSAQVDHVYTLYTYELNEDGKYELTAHDPIVEEKVQYSEDLRATTVYNVSDAPKAGYEDYGLNGDEGDYAGLLQSDNSLSFVLQDDPADNIRTLHFEQVVDKREAIEVTVEHYYTKNITAIEDGAVINYNDPAGVLGLTETFDAYVGERFEAVEETVYEGDLYNSDESTVEVIAGSGREADLYYDRFAEDDERSYAEISVHHIYTTHLTTVVDGSVQTLTVVEGPEVEVYEDMKAGDSFTATAQPVYNGNEFAQITAEDDLSVIL